MAPYQIILTAYIVFINMTAYAFMCFDKSRSKKKGARVPENNLFLLALSLGAVGIYLGMKAPLYHKSAKPKFKIGIPLMVILNVACVYLYLMNF
jgi:uncharacterized membrane protein YsdA (DUF1294 family)